MHPFTALTASLHFTSIHFSSLIIWTLHFTLLCYSYLHLTSLHFLSPSLPFTVFHFPNPRFGNMRFTVGSPCRYPPGSWFQSVMVLFTKEHFLTSVICFLARFSVYDRVWPPRSDGQANEQLLQIFKISLLCHPFNVLSVQIYCFSHGSVFKFI